MFKKSGLMRRTFSFAALLIVLVTLVSFLILYFAMPSYYLYKKEQSLAAGVEQLTKELKLCDKQEQCAVLIREFSENYNVKVHSFDSHSMPLFHLSSAFLSLSSQQEEYTVLINGETISGEQIASLMTGMIQRLSEMEDFDFVLDMLEESMVDSGGEMKLEMNTFVVYDVGADLVFQEDIGTSLIGSIQIQGSLQPIEEARGVILSLIPYVLVAGCTIGLALAWVYARQITRPILQLSATAVRMKEMEPDVVSAIKTNDELGLLSENMDSLYVSLSEMIEKLQTEMEKVNHLEQSKTEMMQSAGHELKTPIAALGGMLDGMIDHIGVYKDREKYLLKCREQVEKLSFLVKEILDAAKADSSDDSTLSGKQADTEIHEMIGHILTEYEMGIKEKALTLNVELQAVTIRTNQALLYRAVANLIGNAVQYTPQQGNIRIVLEENKLEIENDSIPIPEEELSRLFEPFYTRSSSRDRSVSGTGLGLYIVKRNLEKLSIPFEVRNTEHGIIFSLFFSNNHS